MDIVDWIVGISSYGFAYYFMNRDKHKEIIEKCIKEVRFIRVVNKEKYKSYQYLTDGREIQPYKLQQKLSDYIGKPVEVFFNRVLTVRVYKNNIPREWKLDSIEKGRICIGMSARGKVFHDFSIYPHLVIAGSTGYGKTNLIKNIIEQISKNYQIILIDLKNSDDYSRVSAGTIEEARDVLSGIDKNTFVIIDEAHELMPKTYMTRKEGRIYRECMEKVSEIARMGRSQNIHLIYTTQYPTADVLPREIKQNAEARIVFRLVTEVASRVALDEGGAEKLPTGLRGRAIYKTDSFQKIQTPKWKEKGDWENVSVREKETKRIRDYIDIG